MDQHILQWISSYRRPYIQRRHGAGGNVQMPHFGHLQRPVPSYLLHSDQSEISLYQTELMLHLLLHIDHWAVGCRLGSSAKPPKLSVCCQTLFNSSIDRPKAAPNKYIRSAIPISST